jgi:hypothetical protein
MSNTTSGLRTQQKGNANVIPLTPTEAAQPGTPGTPGLVAPTQPMMGEGIAGASPYGGLPNAAGRPMPVAPTYRRPTMSPPSMYSPSPLMTAFDQQRTQLSAATAPQKAFAGYQPPPSGASPYMNLFRTDTSGGTIDNYTTLVRPALQQQAANQQFGNDIYGLDRNARLQSAAIQQFNQTNRSLQGIGTPQYYMNTGAPNPAYGGAGAYFPTYGQ